MRPKVTFVSQAPTPYLTPVLNALAERVELDVLFFRRPGGSWRRNEAWYEFEDPWGQAPRFTHRFERSVVIHEPRTDFHAQIAVGPAWRALSRSNPDAVIVHGWGPLVVEPLAWATARRRARVLWTESHAQSGLIRTGLSDRIRSLVLRRADMIVSNGTLATAYAVVLGAEPDRIITSCLPSRSIPEDEAATASADGTGSVRFLFVGRLVRRKRASLAIEAFGAVAGRRSDVELLVVGTGPEESSLRAQAAAYGDRVRFAGRLEQRALGQAYASADVLLVPSAREVWGLVVNEALAAGLFVVASSDVGSAIDLLDVDSGEIVASGDGQGWRDAISRAADVDRSEVARERRRRRVAGCTPELFARDFERAVHLALRDSPPAGGGNGGLD